MTQYKINAYDSETSGSDRNRRTQDDSKRLSIMRYGGKRTLLNQAVTCDVIYRRYRDVTTKR